MQYYQKPSNSKENLISEIKDHLLKTMYELYRYNQWVIEQLKNEDEDEDNDEDQTIKENLEDCDKLYQQIVILDKKINTKLQLLFKRISHATKEQSLRWHKFNIVNKIHKEHEYIIKTLPYKYEHLSINQCLQNICFELFETKYNELDEYINTLLSE